MKLAIPLLWLLFGMGAVAAAGCSSSSNDNGGGDAPGGGGKTEGQECACPEWKQGFNVCQSTNEGPCQSSLVCEGFDNHGLCAKTCNTDGDCNPGYGCSLVTYAGMEMGKFCEAMNH